MRIPANALVDENGNPPPGLVKVAISTYDIEAEMEMPGDYTIAAPGNIKTIGAMESYGAAYVEVRDGNRSYNLKKDVEAELLIPIAAPQQAVGAPLTPAMAIYHYDEKLGVWNETGSASLTPGGYATKVRHFSAINADVEKQEPACIHVRTFGTGGILPDEFDLEVTIPADPGSGAAAKIRTGTIDSASTDDHVIYNLPVNRDIVLVRPTARSSSIPAAPTGRRSTRPTMRCAPTPRSCSFPTRRGNCPTAWNICRVWEPSSPMT